jgi:D-glycero-alpha-D-manno-heptose-7-phosphate kinase
MIISKTPYRISLFGGGTDFPQYYKYKNNSGVISTSINKYCYISIRELPNFFDHLHRISYSKIEEVKSIDDIKHPVIKAILNLYKINKGLEIHYDGDMPARSGLGSSSSFTVGMLNVMMELLSIKNNNRILADQAMHVEQNLLGEAVGSQDQIITSFGGFNHIAFDKKEQYEITPLNLPKNEVNKLQDTLMLFYTGIQRYAVNIEKDKIKNLEINIKYLDKIAQIKNEALKIFSKSKLNISEIGALLNESWEYKKLLSTKVSFSLIDQAYEIAIKNGALGGKLLGAGGGGFLLFIVPLSKQNKVREVLKSLLETHFLFENEGSKIIFNSNKPYE